MEKIPGEELRKLMEKIPGHDLNMKQWLICQLPAKYGGFGLRSGKLTAGAQHIMSLQKCNPSMNAHARDWNLKECAKLSSQSWLKDHIGSEFDLDTYLSDSDSSLEQKTTKPTATYILSLAQRCEHTSYTRLLKLLTDRKRLPTRELLSSGSLHCHFPGKTRICL